MLFRSDRGKRILELFNQPQYDPIAVEIQISVLWAVQNGFFDDVAVPRVKEFQMRLAESLTASNADLLATIGREKTLNDTSTAGLKAAVTRFKTTWS